MDAASIPGASHRSHEYVDQERRVSSGRFRQLNVRIDGNISDEAFSMQGLSWVAMNKTSRDRYLRISNLLTPAISELVPWNFLSKFWTDPYFALLKTLTLKQSEYHGH
ncbi:hypothetical protein ACHAO8_006304 [Botrytis cinerea]